MRSLLDSSSFLVTMKLSTVLLGTCIPSVLARIVLDKDYELPENANTVELTARPISRAPLQSTGIGNLPLESAFKGTDLQVSAVRP
jgi:hypothetical protein